jgi:hypothetical protein
LQPVDKEVLLATRKRLLEDFEFWAKNCCQVRTKEATIVPLVLNKVQKRFLKSMTDQLATKGYIRMVVLKARQQGLSTVISAYQYFQLSQHKAQKGLVMAHESESTASLWTMYQRMHDNAPALVKPSHKYSSKTELVFDKLDTALRIATAGGRGVARGETLTVAHLSEVAFWPPAFAAANFNGLVQAVPDMPGTAVFLESTAQGMVGKFREMWVGAVKGKNGYIPFFSAWFESSEYRTTAPADFVRTPDEEDLIKTFGSQGLTDNDQLYWRRLKINASGMDLFMQEYPATPDEAFISTGRPVFNPDYLHKRLQAPVTPLKLMAVDFVDDASPVGVLNENARGELRVYHARDSKETYVIGADVGMGLKKSSGDKRDSDESVAQILDSQLRQVAVWSGVVHPDVFAKILITLGYHYNGALLAPERNNHGLVTCINLRNFDYPYIYTDVTEGTLDPGRDTINIGHFTSERTKPLVIDKLRASDRDRDIEINDTQTLEQMLSYVVTEAGKMQAEDGEHDDHVMALAIANYVHDGKWKPVSFSDDAYIKAI